MRLKLVIITLLASAVVAGCSNTKPASSAATSSAEAVAGNVQKVKTASGIDGEIVGTPAPASKFKALQIGMSMQQVINAIGQPSDQGDYESGKRWIPFYYGDDMRRTEMVYKGQGRLTFASGSVFGGHDGALIRITHNANEAGTR